MKNLTYGIFVTLGLLMVTTIQSCKKDPSILKVFVKSAVNDITPNARVVIIADIQENDSDIEYVDTLYTNEGGFITFDVSEYFSEAGKSVEVAYFDIIARKDGKQGVGYARVRVRNTAVESVYLEE